MACEICEHCLKPILDRYDSIMRAGWSYHSECHKCYVCSETNLKDAEIFQGVIFCSSCSKRIFQGCSSAKRNKNIKRCKPENRSVSPKRRDRGRPHKLRRPELPQPENVDVIELARFTRSFNSDSEKNQHIEAPANINLSSALSVYFDTGGEEEEIKQGMKRYSAEIGMMTDVTLQFLQEMNCPVPENKFCRKELISYSPRQAHQKQTDNFIHCPMKYTFQIESVPSYQSPKIEKYKEQIKPRRKPKYSDIRMVEMGASTEIANMTLKKPSDFPVMMKKTREQYETISGPSDISSRTNYSSKNLVLESNEALGKLSSNAVESRPIFITLLRKLNTYFKRKILDRSSLISVLMTSVHDNKSFICRIKDIFSDDICPHHQDGVKKLYPTINRRKSSYKLGWPHTPVYGSKVKRPCKHFIQSDSYYCLRNYVMRRAGPTRSELAKFRGNAAKIFMPRFIKNLIINKTTVSAACGDSEAASKCRIKSSRQSHTKECLLRKGNIVQNYSCYY